MSYTSKFGPIGGFLRKAIAPEVQEAIKKAKKRARRIIVGTRHGQSLAPSRPFPRKDTIKARTRRRLRALADEARRRRHMRAILPPQQGHRRPEFSSPIPGKWATATGEVA